MMSVRTPGRRCAAFARLAGVALLAFATPPITAHAQCRREMEEHADRPQQQADRPQQHAVTVVVQAHDYAFQLPDTLRAGTVTLALDNRGTVAHELVLLRYKPGHTFKSVMAMPREERRSATSRLAIVFAEPGKPGSARVVVELEAGQEYALVCSLRDAVDKPPHSDLGMIKPFYVK